MEGGAPPSGPPPAESHIAQYLGVGCVTVIAGFFSGGMIAVLIGTVVSRVQRCAPEEGLPACNFEVFLAVGAVLGAVSLPWLTIRRLRQSHRSSNSK